MRSVIGFATSLVISLICCVQNARAQWHPETVFNTAGDWNSGANQIKGVKIVALAGGGVGGLYDAGSRKLTYRTYSGTGVLGTASTIVTSPNNIFNPDIAQLNNGTIAAVWEQWSAPSGGVPEVGYSQSTNAGASFSAAQTMTASGGTAKWPNITAQGTANDGAAMITYMRTGGGAGSAGPVQYLFNNNGAGYGADTALGNNTNAEYTAQFDTQAKGTDGSVWRFWGEASGSIYSLKYRRFDPTTETWSAAQTAASGLTSYISRLSAAVADNGKVMLAWDMDSGTYGVTLSGGVWSAPTNYINQPFFGNIVAKPASNDFYLFSAYQQDFPVMQPILNGTIDMPLEYPGTTLSNTFIPWAYGAIDVNGQAYITWEEWSNSAPTNPQAMIAFRDTLNPVPEPSTLALLGIAGGTLFVTQRIRRRRQE